MINIICLLISALLAYALNLAIDLAITHPWLAGFIITLISLLMCGVFVYIASTDDKPTYREFTD